MDIREINWFGLVCAGVTSILVIISLYYATPWWTLTIAEDVGSIGLSPMDINIQILDASPDIPLIFYLTLAMKLTLIASAVALALYSVAPNREWSNNVLGFGYKKPVWATLLFIIVVFLLTLLVGILAPITIPLAGSEVASIELPPVGGSIRVPITTGFTFAFYLALVAVATAIAARIYHTRISTVD